MVMTLEQKWLEAQELWNEKVRPNRTLPRDIFSLKIIFVCVRCCDHHHTLQRIIPAVCSVGRFWAVLRISIPTVLY